MMKLLQYGAGNIGRSLVGQLFSKAGYEVVFVDVDKTVIDALNRERDPLGLAPRIISGCFLVWPTISTM